MSTKIYEAFRVKRKVKLFPLLRDLQNTATKNAINSLTNTYIDYIQRLSLDLPEYKKELASYERMYSDELSRISKVESKLDGDENFVVKLAKISTVGKLMKEGFREQLGKSSKNVFDYSCSIAIHEYKNRFYIIPYRGIGISNSIFNFLAANPFLEDYTYWNNTDRPDKVTASEWKERGKVWDAICDQWQSYVSLTIISGDNYYMIDPEMDLMRAVLQKEGKYE